MIPQHSAFMLSLAFARRRRLLVWLAAGCALLLGALWGGSEAWADETIVCGRGTVPGPCAVHDIAVTRINTPVTIPVLANDIDRSGTGLAVSAVGSPLRGAAVRNADNTVTYRPQRNFWGFDLFTYTVKDGLDIPARGTVLVIVSPWHRNLSHAYHFERDKDHRSSFTDDMLLPDGSRVHLSTSVHVPAGAITAAVQPADVLAVVFTSIVTPTGNIAAPPGGLSGQDPGGSVWAHRYANLTIDLDVLHNDTSLKGMALARPLTFTVIYGPHLLNESDERTLSIYYWNGSNWVNDGIVVAERDPGLHRIVFTVDRVAGELSFFAQSRVLLFPYIAQP